RKLDIGGIRYNKLKASRDTFDSSQESLTKDQKSLELKILQYKKHKNGIDKVKGDLDSLRKEKKRYNDEIKILNS
ncbi:hypothetical protein CGH51_25555, partial [Vibrio parahaemolyticus]|uniref:hypothetical protein n=1 Tax=Vibrio parahaemolyticus TaxID=670 RepID=UPI0011696FD9